MLDGPHFDSRQYGEESAKKEARKNKSGNGKPPRLASSGTALFGGSGRAGHAFTTPAHRSQPHLVDPRLRVPRVWPWLARQAPTLASLIAEGKSELHNGTRRVVLHAQSCAARLPVWRLDTGVVKMVEAGT